jgi:hypothetical protein
MLSILNTGKILVHDMLSTIVLKKKFSTTTTVESNGQFTVTVLNLLTGDYIAKTYNSVDDPSTDKPQTTVNVVHNENGSITTTTTTINGEETIVVTNP